MLPLCRGHGYWTWLDAERAGYVIPTVLTSLTWVLLVRLVRLTDWGSENAYYLWWVRTGFVCVPK